MFTMWAESSIRERISKKLLGFPVLYDKKMGE